MFRAYKIMNSQQICHKFKKFFQNKILLLYQIFPHFIKIGKKIYLVKPRYQLLNLMELINQKEMILIIIQKSQQKNLQLSNQAKDPCIRYIK